MDEEHATHMTDRKQKKRDVASAAAPGAAATSDEAPAPEATAAAETPASAADVDSAAAELAAVFAERDEYLDHLRRLKAEFENYRKRVHRDHEELRLHAAETVVESLLPVMDNMSRALEAARRHEEGQLLAGLELVADQLRGTLEGHGLEGIVVEPGTLFDPTVHEAIMTQASEEYDEGCVLTVLESGYLLHGRLLRPAKVIVVS